MISLDNINKLEDISTLSSVPDGSTAFILSHLLSEEKKTFLYITRDDARMDHLLRCLHFFCPNVEVLTFPAWDCLPYDRVSPNISIVSTRLQTLCKLLTPAKNKSRIIITTVNAFIQRIPSRQTLSSSTFQASKGDKVQRETLIEFLIQNGYIRVGTVAESGEFAVRGSVIDILTTASNEAYRLDFFGETLESIRSFDPLSQISRKEVTQISILPASEILFNEETITNFRTAYREQFGVSQDDPLYEAISEGRKYAGMEHWLPLFYESLETLLDYVPDSTILYDHLTLEARDERLNLIEDYYQSRQETNEYRSFSDAVYHPIAVNDLYMNQTEWDQLVANNINIHLYPFNIAAGAKEQRGQLFAAPLSSIPNFTAEAKQYNEQSLERMKQYLANQMLDQKKTPKKVVICCFSTGSLERLSHMLSDHDMASETAVSYQDIQNANSSKIFLIHLPLEQGFASEELVFISEQDILGERLIRKAAPKRKAENFISEASSLLPGEIVVHKEHGIGRFEGLETLEITGKSHDCLRIDYHGGDKLYVPVENLDLLSRYGTNDNVPIDKLGGAAWQARKAKLRKRIKVAAEHLLQTAAERASRVATPLAAVKGLYEEFCSRFPYPETDDQLRSIEEVEKDLASTRPLDRLVCGDVGFGKTEAALRAAFIAVMNDGNEKKQVAVVVPTTLLARQHTKTFKDRFAGLPVRIRQLSRMVTSKEMSESKELLKKGEVDIVIGTHALLAKQIKFHNLGLVIVDEEQHFGVAQKERLKELQTNVHVLTLTATPIPRTLQMSLAGIRELSIIATPPIDRLAVRTYVMAFDPLAIREAILREHYRGGQTFYVCPRIKDLEEVEKKLKELVPEVKIVTAHGQMSAQQLDDIMNAFYDGKYDILLSTTIVESGLDIPTANTLIVHRADMYGLAQLYQIRGRVGRGKVRGYAYLTLPPKKLPTKTALKRLEVMQSLDTLGAGFSLASHDMDIRGFGNILGDEQSGHIKEVGIELYQEMLKETIDVLKSGEEQLSVEEEWSPQINLGVSVLIPENYVPDLSVRMGLYKRISYLSNADEVEAFAAELIDRFGSLPQETEHLLTIVKIKQLCKIANIERIDLGSKGAVVRFFQNNFANPEALISFIGKNPSSVKLRGDHSLVIKGDYDSLEARIKGMSKALGDIAGLVVNQ